MTGIPDMGDLFAESGVAAYEPPPPPEPGPDTCPECGHEESHNPKTGFCWKSTSNPRSGWHCKHCCVRAWPLVTKEIPDEEGTS